MNLVSVSYLFYFKFSQDIMQSNPICWWFKLFRFFKLEEKSLVTRFLAALKIIWLHYQRNFRAAAVI